MADSLLKLISISIFISVFAIQAAGESDECGAETGSCINKSKALPLKIIAIVAIIVTSLIGVSVPLLTRNISAFNPNGSVFAILKAFASGIILGTGFMHVLPDSFDMLSSECLEENPWHEFPFPGFVAMVSAIVTLAVDSMATSYYSSKGKTGVTPKDGANADGVVKHDYEMQAVGDFHGHHGHSHAHGHHALASTDQVGEAQLLRYRIIAMVLELGIIVHSVVIGLSLGASNNVCSIKSLVAALCFHQMFEGMGLGGSILQAEYKLMKRLVMAFFFSATTPFGIALGIALSKTYRENSPNALITVGLLNASSAGLLIYMALVDLLAVDFMGPKLQNNFKLLIKCTFAVLLGAGGMSILAKWA
ncbi:Zinc/iron permease [Dillenia turbinata]|uniref:Zinc/iron permease n=1 Tax=Dillenia turbinata TaxID=194707 RepID=A0AAN8ZFH3_9MAGN